MWSVRDLFRRGPKSRQEDSPPAFNVDPEYITCPVPKVLWIELTSTCPFDCVFCTRKTRFGPGQHLDFEIYRALIGGLESPEFIGLNYSGESIYYPRLIEAVELANSTGANTELVTALSSISSKLLEALVATGLDRLAVSLHTTDSRQYKEIYRFGTLELLKERIDDFFRIKRRLGAQKPRLDFCFVAMRENLGQLASIARYAGQVGASEVFIHPVIGRHPLPYDFSRELSANRLRESFKDDLRNAVALARGAAPGVPITVLNPEIDPDPQLGHAPAYFAPPLPPGARIHTCDQSPFESVHVLANGSVVVCEVHDEVPLGNLRNQRLQEIWHSERYRAFRRKYVTAEIPECRDCIWKIAYLPVQWKSAIAAADGKSPQLIRGWYLADRETMIWSKRESLLALRARGRRVRIVGILPRAPGGKTNTLRIVCNKVLIGSITNRSESELSFDRSFPLNTGEATLNFEFFTKYTFCPASWGINYDQRHLGFALGRIEVRH
jgi:MoaA/NifB/PqqE/SkfB family radical SAM enzyme